MKKQIMYCFALVAMAFAMFATPAMAVEGWDDRNLIAAHAEIMPEIVAIDDRPMLAEYSARPQLEAADLYLTEIQAYKVTSAVTGPTPAQWPDGSGAMHEVGWRVSTTAT